MSIFLRVFSRGGGGGGGEEGDEAAPSPPWFFLNNPTSPKNKDSSSNGKLNSVLILLKIEAPFWKKIPRKMLIAVIHFFISLTTFFISLAQRPKFKRSITKPSRKHETEVLRSYQAKENSYLYQIIFGWQAYDLLIPIHIYKMAQKLKGSLCFEISGAINKTMEIQDC